MDENKTYVYIYTSPEYDENSEVLIKNLNITHTLSDYEKEYLFKKKNILFTKLYKKIAKLYNKIRGG